MKTFLFIVLFCLTGIFGYAQEHLTFRNLPIDGPVESFVQKLENLGYTTVHCGEDGAVLEGEFVTEECSVVLLLTHTSKLVYCVNVRLPKEQSWFTIRREYKELKTQFNSKYGKGVSYEYFIDPYYEGDGYEMQALRHGKCKYFTKWNVDDGTIILYLETEERISIAYVDKINETINNQEAESKILDEI